tara:strand:- start:1754 stop:2326 length:573 start_codon:yes stop_codon:yes gene_type:complete
MEWGKQMEKHQENAKLLLYQNTNYTFERRERKTLIIDSINNKLDNNINFTTELTEPLIVDKLSDIYLESFTTFNCSSNSSQENMCFLLDIEQFNINSNCAFNASKNSSGIPHNSSGTYSFNRIIIPNENNSGSNVGTHIHKSKKLNYICSINPTRINSINGKVTNLDNKSIISDSGRFILELIIVARDKD